jgi:hypothetical protein
MEKRREQPQTRRFEGKTYVLIEFGRDVCPGRAALLSRYGERFSNFRTVLGVDGKWAVYGLTTG